MILLGGTKGGITKGGITKGGTCHEGWYHEGWFVINPSKGQASVLLPTTTLRPPALINPTALTPPAASHLFAPAALGSTLAPRRRHPCMFSLRANYRFQVPSRCRSRRPFSRREGPGKLRRERSRDT